MFKNVTIRARLTLALGLFMVLLVVGAAVGLVSLRQSNASLQEIYSNDMASSRSLAQTTISTLAARVTLSRIEFIADPTEIKTAIDSVRINLKKADDAWGNYAALPMSEGEIGSVATVSYSAQASVKTHCTMPQLAVRMTSPGEVMIGNQQHVKIEIKNPGSGDATGVMLFEARRHLLALDER